MGIKGAHVNSSKIEIIIHIPTITNNYHEPENY